MKRTLILCLCLMLLMPGAYAKETFRFYVSADGTESGNRIDWYKDPGGYTLFLPGCILPGEWKIGFTGADSITLDGAKCAPGDAFPYVPGKEKYTLSCAGKKYSLRVMVGSPLPALFITTQSGGLDFIHKSKENKEPGTLLFVAPGGESQYDGALTHIKTRGNSSLTFKKKNYQLKLETGANLLGFGKSRTWILTGNYRDKSLLRNQITLDMAMYAGMPYTPQHQSADVYINHEYMGTYLFSEKIMVDDDRVDIFDLEQATEQMNGDLSEARLIGAKTAQPGKYKAYDIKNDPPDLTGGYLVEFEAYSARYKQEKSVYHTMRKNTLVVKSPEYCSDSQMRYISSLMQSFENAIFSPDGTDPGTGRHYGEIIDLPSLVRKYMVEEISKNYDGNNSSMYFYKPRDDQSTVAFAGPVWNYDSAYGSYAREDNQKKVLPPAGLYVARAGGSLWWPALYRQADFRDMVDKLWQDTFSHAVRILLGREKDEKGVLRAIDDYQAEIALSAQMNFTRWPIPKKPSTVAQTGNTFDKNIAFLKNFISERYDFLNEEWGK